MNTFSSKLGKETSSILEIKKENIDKIIPEYVEYIGTSNPGKVVKVLYWSASSHCKVQFSDGVIQEPFKHLVKPSTKEAYENQFTTKFKKEFKAGDYVISNYNYITLPHNKISQILEVSETGIIKLKEGEFNPADFRLATALDIYPEVIGKIEHAVYKCEYDSPKPIQIKPLIENVQSVSVNLHTKKKINKFKF